MIIEVTVILLTVLILRYWLSRPKGMPPGPMCFPGLGSGLVMNLKKAKEYQDKYGNIFRCEMGSLKSVYLCDFKLIKEAMNKVEFADRLSLEGFNFMTDGKEAGVILSNGEHWTNLRRFLLRNLRNLGMGKSSLDDAIMHESRTLVEDFQKYVGTPTMFPYSINIVVLNVIWQMVASHRYDLDDKEMLKFMKLMKKLQDDSYGFMILETFPILKKILPKYIKNKFMGLKALGDVVVVAKKLLGDTIAIRRAKLDPLNAENVIDEYLIQMDEKTDIAQYFNELDLMRTIFDLFSAGFDTTSNMLRWIILYAANYQQVQKRIQKQIDDVIPRDEFPSHRHKAQLPILEAFIYEVLRYSSLIPFSVMHATNTDTNLAGYHIPKATMVFSLTGLCHQDPKYWDDPQEFRIERFLDDEGRFVSHKEGFAPFGIGKRSCLGEALARMELSIFTAALLQNFTFSPPEGKSIDLTPDNLPMAHFARSQEFLISARV